MRDSTSTLSGGIIDHPDIEIPRDDLFGLVHAQTGGTRYLFDDTVTDLEQDASSVLVSISHNTPEAFDLVIGAVVNTCAARYAADQVVLVRFKSQLDLE